MKLLKIQVDKLIKLGKIKKARLKAGLKIFSYLLVGIRLGYLPRSANAGFWSFDVNYFFVEQLEILKRGRTIIGTHKHLTINPDTLSHKHYGVNEVYLC